MHVARAPLDFQKSERLGESIATEASLWSAFVTAHELALVNPCQRTRRVRQLSLAAFSLHFCGQEVVR